MTDEKGIVVRIVYADLSSELLKLDIKKMSMAIQGLADKESIHLDGKEVVEIHMLSHFNHANYTKIEGSTKDGFALTILEKNNG